MIKAFIVVCTDRHIDPEFWVCLDLRDALVIANKVANSWAEHYGVGPGDVDTTVYPGLLWRKRCEDGFNVYIKSQSIREDGENDPL